MAPEQVRGAADVDHRIDLYAVGAIVFRALTGRQAFEGANALTLVARKLDRPAPSLRASGERFPVALDAFVTRMMAREREERFASATEALAAWRRLTLS